jgi:hypothetical protein
MYGIPGHRSLNKHDETVDSTDGFAFERGIVDRNRSFITSSKH